MSHHEVDFSATTESFLAAQPINLYILFTKKQVAKNDALPLFDDRPKFLFDDCHGLAAVH